jgi:hypothetical protein
VYETPTLGLNYVHQRVDARTWTRGYEQVVARLITAKGSPVSLSMEGLEAEAFAKQLEMLSRKCSQWSGRYQIKFVNVIMW